MDVFFIRLAYGDSGARATLSGQILRNFDSQILAAREETVPAIGIAPPSASGRAHPLDHVWIVGDDNLAGNPPRDWREVKLTQQNINGLFNFPTLTDEAKLASGLVLRLAAAEPVRIELAQMESVDVVLVVDGPGIQDTWTKYPPPWLTLTLRRRRLRGRVRVVALGVWNNVLEQPAGQRESQLFPKSEDASCWTKLLDRSLPLGILRIESTAAKPLRWRTADKNSSIPFRTAQPFVAPVKGGCRISYAKKRYGPNLTTNNVTFDNAVRQDMVARNDQLDGESLAIIIHVAGDTIDAPKNPDWKSYELTDDALSKVNRQDGIEQIIEIDRFGRVTLTHLDSFDRPIPCFEPNKDPNKDKGCRLSLDLGNVLFPGLPREYPVELARISYNGEPSDLGPDEAEDRTSAVPPQSLPPGRSLILLFGDRNKTIRDVWAKIKGVGSTRIEEPKREALRLLDHPDPLLNALREKVDKWTGGDEHSYEAIKEEIGQQIKNPDSKRISDDALNELLQLVPVEMPDYRAAIESLVRRFK